MCQNLGDACCQFRKAGQQPCAHRGRAETLAGAAGVGAANGGAGRGHCRRRSLRPCVWVLEKVRLPRAGAVQQHAAPLLLGPEPRGPAPVPELVGELQFRAVTPEPASAQLRLLKKKCTVLRCKTLFFSSVHLYTH